jgi:CheY-like chemotaxis protein
MTQIAVGGGTDTRFNPNTVLVVDDDADLREALRDFLRDEGYAVTLASNGQEALGLLPTLKRPCGIVLDIAMPGMNGTEFYRAMSALPAFADIPVVVLTTDSSRGPGGLPKMKKTNLELLLSMVAALF